MPSPGNNAQRALKRVRKSADKLERSAVKKHQQHGRVIHARLATLFVRMQYYPQGSDTLALLGPNTVKWTKRKARLALQLRRGHASGTLQRAASSTSSFIIKKDGWSISWPRANFRASPSPGYNPGPVNTYFRFVNEQKAQSSLGKPSPKQIQTANNASMAAIRSGLNRALPGAMKVKGGIAILKLKLGRFGDF